MGVISGMESLDTLLQLITQVYATNPIFGLIATFVTLASGIAAVTPTPKPTSVLGKLYKVIDFLALNIGAAKDKGDGK